MHKTSDTFPVFVVNLFHYSTASLCCLNGVEFFIYWAFKKNYNVAGSDSYLEYIYEKSRPWNRQSIS